MQSGKTDIEIKKALLRSSTVLSGTSDAGIDKLAASSKFVTVQKGGFLFHHHDPAGSLYILRSGVMSIILSSFDGRDLIIDELQPGDFFGEVSLLASGTRTAGAQARENCELLEISADTFLGILDNEPLLTRYMLELATARLYRAQQRESALAFLGAPARLARVLLDMDEQDRQGPDKGYIAVSQEELALHTGLTRQTVASNLSQWRKRDYILTGRGRILILNREAIRRIKDESLL